MYSTVPNKIGLHKKQNVICEIYHREILCFYILSRDYFFFCFVLKKTIFIWTKAQVTFCGNCI